jgi:hypothetical protein
VGYIQLCFYGGEGGGKVDICTGPLPPPSKECDEECFGVPASATGSGERRTGRGARAKIRHVRKERGWNLVWGVCVRVSVCMLCVGVCVSVCVC